MKKFILWLIKKYQATYSLDHGKLGDKYPNYRVCRFTPSCSEYSYTAIERFGLIKGGAMALYRVLRCNPLTPVGTYDPVPDKR